MGSHFQKMAMQAPFSKFLPKNFYTALLRNPKRKIILVFPCVTPIASHPNVQPVLHALVIVMVFKNLHLQKGQSGGLKALRVCQTDFISAVIA